MGKERNLGLVVPCLALYEVTSKYFLRWTRLGSGGVVLTWDAEDPHWHASCLT